MKYAYAVLLTLVVFLAGGVLTALAFTYTVSTINRLSWWVIPVAIVCIILILVCTRLIVSLLLPGRRNRG